MKYTTPSTRGVTEMIAHRVLRTYTDRSMPKSITRADVDEFLELQQSRTHNVYAIHIFAVKLYAALVAKAVDVPPDVVESGMMRGYMRGSEFIEDEMLPVLSDLLGSGKGTDLKLAARLGGPKEMVRAMNQIELKVDLKTRQRLVKAYLR